MILWAALNTAGYCLWRMAFITGERMAACSDGSCVVIALVGSGGGVVGFLSFLSFHFLKVRREEGPGGDNGSGNPSR